MRKNRSGRILIITVCMMLLMALCDRGQDGEQKNVNISATTGVKDVLQAQMEKENEARKSEGKDGQEGTGQSNEESMAENASQGQDNAGNGGNAGTEAGKTQNAGEAAEKKESSLQPDMDLTVMSATMVYSEVYQMMYYPETYVGKVIKIKGQYAISEMGDMRYDLCIIKDATACCAQGMEFLLTDAYVYPKDYPEVGDEIELVGTFDTYYEGEYLYCTLRNSTLRAMQ